MRRKLFDYTAGLIAGVLTAFYLSKVQFLLIGAVCMSCLIWIVKKRRTHSARTVIVCFFLLGLTLMILTESRFTSGALYRQSLSSDTESVIKGRVIEVECIDDNQYRLTLKVKQEKLLCSYYAHLENPWAVLGCIISFSGKIEMPDERGNPRCFDYRLYLRTQGIGYVSTIASFNLDDPKQPLRYRCSSYILTKRDAFLTLLSNSSTSKGLLRGILFGDTNQMDEELYDSFRKNGTAHVLAVSGLHVGMLYGIYRSVYVRFHRWWVTVCFLLFLMLYGTATLWSISVTRAVILICLVILGDLLHRRYDLLTALAAVALFVVVKNPYVLFSAGFQMSFLAVISIIFLQEPMARVFGKKLSTSAAVQAGLMPYMAYVFNYISLTGLFCNIPVVFLASCIVPLGMSMFLCYFLFDTSVPILNVVLSRMGDMLVLINNLFSADGRFSFDVVSPPLWMMVLIYSLLFYGTSEHAFIAFKRKRWNALIKAAGVILLAAVFSCTAASSSFDRASLVFVDVGQGDCLHIKTDNGRTILIDGGGNINYNVGEQTIKPYLLKNGFKEVNLAAATHLHTDHYLGLQQLAECFPVKSILTSGKAGDRVMLSSSQWLEILWPLTRNPKTEDENLNSLIFMVHDQGVKTLITGDITAEGEALLVEQYAETDKLKADILKIAHHGSAYSTSDRFLEAVRPKIAVISVGRNNYGHPSENVIEKLEKNGIMVFRTDLDGAVGIINKKGKISICTENQRQNTVLKCFPKT